MAQITTRLVAVATTASSPSPPTRNLRAASPRSSSTTTKTTTSPREYCGLSSNPSRLRPLRRRRRVAATPFALFGVGAASKTAPPSSSEIVPGQGAGSPKWPEIYDAIASDALRVRTIEASDLRSFLASREGARATLVDVRQAIEHDEWRLAGSINVPYAIPDPFWPRRVVGYAISIKGGLKVRNPRFVEDVDDAVCGGDANRRGDKKACVVLIDTKGGDLTRGPIREGSGTLDASDASCLRAAYELRQAGYADVRHVRGGLPGAIEDGELRWESETWGDFLRWLDTWNPDQRRLLMYSRLLPDPTNLPGVVGQLAVFTTIGLAYYDVGGIGTWAAANVPAACSFLPVCS